MIQFQETKLIERVLRLMLENDIPTYEEAFEYYAALVMVPEQTVAWGELFPSTDCDSVSWRPDGEGVQHG